MRTTSKEYIIRLYAIVNDEIIFNYANENDYRRISKKKKNKNYNRSVKAVRGYNR